jgi:predicted enzyme related to lactoylglutathione lyase
VRLTFVRLLVDDYAACFRFHRDVMEFPVTFGDESSGYADFDAGADVQVAVFERREQMEQVGGDDGARGMQAALVLQVVDVDSALAGLRDRGATVAAEPASRSDWGIRVAYVRDPAGNLLELNQPIPIKE